MCSAAAKPTRRDGDAATCLVSQIGGEHEGAAVSSWVTPSNGRIKVSFYSQGTSYCPDGGTCQASCSVTCPYPYKGVSLEAVDYRQYQTGTTPLLLPIRFPGQYYDAETDLESSLEKMPDRFPVDPCRLHRNVRTSVRRQPVSKRD